MQSTERNSHCLRNSYHILATAVTHLSHLQEPLPNSYPMTNLSRVRPFVPLHCGVTLEITNKRSQKPSVSPISMVHVCVRIKMQH